MPSRRNRSGDAGCAFILVLAVVLVGVPLAAMLLPLAQPSDVETIVILLGLAALVIFGIVLLWPRRHDP